uniref:WGS project CAEQ00000000 data, annotated contig 129 n=1 Tax=Trypanosoma congolense (strain IL3000) TaxID=1068625 RepID=F9W595_TRYCI|nr:unnamed protein product [Trypanosoma congolense IL3000]
MQTPLRPTIGPESIDGSQSASSFRKPTGERALVGRSNRWSADQERRRLQREKQLSFGYATDGYRNMVKLVEHDPLLRSGGVIPLLPPDIDKGSKRLWDVSLRKWRRALHMFDCVFIDGESNEGKTLEDIVEEQRQQWVSKPFTNEKKENRVRVPVEAFHDARNSPHVCTKLHVEECLKVILRDESCYEPVCNVVPTCASSLLKGSDVTPADAGIKIFVAPSPSNAFGNAAGRSAAVYNQVSPQCLNFDMVTPLKNKVPVSGVHKVQPFQVHAQPQHKENTNMWLAPTIWMDDGMCGSPYTTIYQPLIEHITDFQQTPLNPNLVIAPQLYVAPSSPADFPGPIFDKFTPATAPRRLTFLKSSSSKISGGEVDTPKRNLFPNNAMSPCHVDPSGRACSLSMQVNGTCVRRKSTEIETIGQVDSNCAQQIVFTE